jgi:lysyl-tRNA synthetase, class I
MFWADRIALEIKQTVKPRAGAGKPLLIRDEKTASGKVHVGSMRGVAIHGALSSVLNEMGVANEFKYEINDFDPFDGLPNYLPQSQYEPLLGKQLLSIPSPDPSAPNYAEFYGGEFMQVINDTGYHPTYYRSSELYLSGRMDEAIRLVLTNAKRIGEIYKEVSGSQSVSERLPLSVLCENCGKISMTKATDFDGETVAYMCLPAKLDWGGVGCGHEGRVSPFGGRAKLPWKPEWAAKWFVLGVDVEGAGKDHSTKGGARDVANHIAKDVFNIEPPFDVPYEFFLVGGQKMASSKGRGSSARDVADLIPPKIFRLALLGKEINQAFNFDPAGETIPTLYDQYDKLADSFLAGTQDDYVRLFRLIENNLESEPAPAKFRVRFSQAAFMSQMPHLSLEKEAEGLKGSALDEAELSELRERAEYAAAWLTSHAPEKYRFALQQSLPAAAAELSEKQKEALNLIAEKLAENPSAEELHEYIHGLKDVLSLKPQELFSAVYLVFLNKKEGPKAGWFVATLDRDYALRRLQEASAA